MNISRIANRTAGGERAARTAQSMYWSCHNTMRTQILNWRQRCRNCKVGTAVRFQPGWRPAGFCPVRVTNPPGQCGSCFWPGVEPNQTKPQANNRTAGRLAGPIANTTLDSASSTMKSLFTCAQMSPAENLKWLSRIVPIQESTVSFLRGLCFLHLVDPVQQTIWTAYLWHWKDITGIATTLYRMYFASFRQLKY